MADSPRIEQLRRRVLQDPASIAFAALAEEYRRAGRITESIETARAGLARHPGYTTARVTLGRALGESGATDEARHELEQALVSAPENLAAIRALADLYRRTGQHEPARDLARRGVLLAPQDPDLHDLLASLPPGDSTGTPAARGEEPATGSASPAPVMLVRGDEPAPGLASPAPVMLAAAARPAGLGVLERWRDALAEERRRRARPAGVAGELA